METGILPPELRSIEQLFTGDARYAVPKYQRSFAWTLDEVEELWEDLLSAVERRSDYFLGTIVLHRRTSGPIEIIDGQQRLASISMIFSSIRNIFLAAQDKRENQLYIAFLGAPDFSRNAPANPKLVLNKINNETYVEYVLESKNLDDVDAALKNRNLGKSNRLLLQAYRYFLDKVVSAAGAKGTESDSYIVPLIDCIRTSIKLITITVTSEEDANLFFESLNARGKELAISDLVKNRLYSEAGNQVSRAEQLWEKMEADLGRRPIPEFLRHFWIAKKIDEKTITVREKQLYRMIAQDIRGKKTATVTLLQDLSESALDYAKISDYTIWPDEDAFDSSFEKTLNDLRLFRVTQCNPILVNVIQHFKKPKDIARAFRIVANFSFRYFIVGNQSPGNLERVSNTIAVNIRKGNHNKPNDVADAFRVINPDPTFHSDFSLLLIPKSRARIARYVLSKIENHLSGQESSAGQERIVNPDSKKVTLEHVLPQNPSGTWKTYFSKGADPNDYIYRVGNLTLLTQKVNSEAANKSFPEKQKLALNISSLVINKSFRTETKWGDKEIEKRQTELARTALEIWKL